MINKVIDENVYSMKLRELTLDKYKNANLVIHSKDSQSIINCFNHEIPIFYNEYGKVFTIQGLYIADIMFDK